MSVFASWLQAELDARGWDQRDAAMHIGVRESAVHNWLHKGYIPRTKSTLKIARALKKAPAEVMRALGVDVPPLNGDDIASDEAVILAQHPEYREILRMISAKPLDEQATYITLIKRLLSE